MKNPFRTRYRIVEYSWLNNPYEPQVWRWYWPFWRELVWGSCTGHDYSPWSYKTKEEALHEIEIRRNPGPRVIPIIHEIS